MRPFGGGNTSMAWLLPAIVAFLLTLFSAPAALAECRDHAVDVIQDTRLPGAVIFYVSTNRTIEATVHFELPILANAKPSRPFPMTFILTRPYRNYEFARVTQIDPTASWYAGPHLYKFVMGIASKLPTRDYEYSLPYPASEHFTVSQSYFGTFSHQKGTPEEYAVDIVMPEGTPVLAARAGIVIAVRDDSSMGGPSKEFLECFNYVYIKHDDGTYAGYIHLKPESVRVKPGQPVAAGSTIAYSGQTGYATEPHLHFMVYRVSGEAQVKTIPFKMRTESGVVDQLEEGETY